jgi:hypothetical protein
MKKEDQNSPNPERKAHKPPAPKSPPPPREAVHKPAPPKSPPPPRELPDKPAASKPRSHTRNAGYKPPARDADLRYIEELKPGYSNYLEKKARNEELERHRKEGILEKVSIPELKCQSEFLDLKQKAIKVSEEKTKSHFLFGSSSKLENDIFNAARKANTVEMVFELIKSTYHLDRSINLDSFEPLRKKIEEVVHIAQRFEKREAMSKIAKIIDTIVSIFEGVSQNNAISKLKEIKNMKEEFIIKKTPVVSDKKEKGIKF